MIKVTVREKYTKELEVETNCSMETGLIKEKRFAFVEEIKVVEYPKGHSAWVANGVLTIFPSDSKNMDFGQAIAGYEAGAWIAWSREENN